MTKQTRLVMHLDMDAFFAAVEQRNNPKLLGKPVIVGGSPEGRGVVSAASYEARKFGVHSAMSAAKAKRLCPQAIFVSGDFPAYHDASNQMLAILDGYSPTVEAISIDEAFVDLSEVVLDFRQAKELAGKAKQEIYQKLKLTCSVGIASTKHIAKIASDLEKPDGLTVVPDDKLERIIYPLPVSKIWGVGPVTLRSLEKGGVHTIADLALMEEKQLIKKFGRQGERLARLARGMDDRDVLGSESRAHEKSISHEHTLSGDSGDVEVINGLILALADKVVTRMKKGNWRARTLGLKLRYADFTTITRDSSVAEPTDNLNLVVRAVRSLVPGNSVRRRKVRLVGVRVTKLTKNITSPQLALFEDSKRKKNEKLARVVKELRERFGYDIILRAGASRH